LPELAPPITREISWPRQISPSLVLPVLAALVLFWPTLFTLATTLWGTEDHAYAPFVLLAAIWLAWRTPDVTRQPDRAGPAWAALTVLGVLIHLAARVLGNLALETSAALFVVPGLIGWIAGTQAVIRLRYPLLALLFAVPLPGSLVVALTFPLKMAVSFVSAELLQAMQLPVAREGVLIDIGSYRLLVADACSGLQSMFGLAASAVIYLALVGQRSAPHALAMLAAVLPIAFAANVIRVTVLALITYWWGEAAGQGFFHEFAGIAMFGFAFAGLMMVDGLLNRVRILR